MRTMHITDAALATAQDREAGNIADSIEAARERAPWAAEVLPTDDGWVAYEDAKDAATWQRQT